MRIVTKNKNAKRKYEILETFIAGVVLEGSEVKSIKNGSVKIDGAYIFVNPNGAIVRNMSIPIWKHANAVSKRDYEPDRDRAILLTKKQLLKIASKRQQLKAQIVPLAVGIEKKLVKLEIALARPLKKYDAKNRRKEREEKRRIQRIANTKEIVR